MKRLTTFLLFTALVVFAVSPVFAVSKASTDTGYLGNDQWALQSDGDMVPLTDSSYDLGESGGEIANIYADAVTVGGVAIGPATAATITAGATTPTVSSGSLFKTGTGNKVTIDNFTGTTGQTIIIESDDEVTYDVTSSNLKGGTTDLVTVDGDATGWYTIDGTNWILMFFTDQSDDLS